MKRKLVSDGMYVITKDKRRSRSIVFINIKELRVILKHAESMKNNNKELNACFKHLSPDVSFFIKLK